MQLKHASVSFAITVLTRKYAPFEYKPPPPSLKLEQDMSISMIFTVFIFNYKPLPSFEARVLHVLQTGGGGGGRIFE